LKKKSDLGLNSRLIRRFQIFVIPETYTQVRDCMLCPQWGYHAWVVVRVPLAWDNTKIRLLRTLFNWTTLYRREVISIQGSRQGRSVASNRSYTRQRRCCWHSYSNVSSPERRIPRLTFQLTIAYYKATITRRRVDWLRLWSPPRSCIWS